MARTHRLGDRSGPRFEVTFHPTAEKEFLELAPHVQDRFERAIDQAAIDPFRSRPGLDLRKLGDLDQGEALYRLRVGEYRCCYAVITSEKEILVLLFDVRGAGYDRMVRTAAARRWGRRA